MDYHYFQDIRKSAEIREKLMDKCRTDSPTFHDVEYDDRPYQIKPRQSDVESLGELLKRYNQSYVPPCTHRHDILDEGDREAFNRFTESLRRDHVHTRHG